MTQSHIEIRAANPHQRRSMRAIVRDRLFDRHMYRGSGSWLLHLYDRALRRWHRAPLPGRGFVVKVRPAGIENAVSLRLGGSDFSVLVDVCGPRGGEYDIVRTLDLGRMPIIVDLGANIGLSVRLWKTWFPRARVLAAEPDPDNVDMIFRNIPDARVVSEGDADIHVAQVCVADEEGEVVLDRSELPWAYSMRRDARPEDISSAIAVPALTMDGLLQRWGVAGPIDLLKCNIEGAERVLFESGGDWISRLRHFVVETHDDWSDEQLAAALERAGASFQLSTLDKSGGHRRVLGVAEAPASDRTSAAGGA